MLTNKMKTKTNAGPETHNNRNDREQTLNNKLSVYKEVGRKCATAWKRRDYALMRKLTDWTTKAIRMEASENREMCENAYRQAYREEF